MQSESFDACASLQSQVSSTVIFVWSEVLQQCVTAVNCTTNRDCDDGRFCNGREYCVINGSLGTCMGQANLTIAELCGKPDAFCLEGVGCHRIASLEYGHIIIFLFVFFMVSSILFIGVIIKDECRKKKTD